MPPAFALFETVLGACGIAWTDAAIVGVQLPERDRRATQERMCRRFPEAREADPPAAVRAAIVGIERMLAGEPGDLSHLALDMHAVAPFDRQVYAIARTIPFGETLTYGDVARRLGDPRRARAVGQALGRNPFAPVVPCHRVLASDGRLGGFSAAGGAATKRAMLENERARGVPRGLPLADPAEPDRGPDGLGRR